MSNLSATDSTSARNSYILAVQEYNSACTNPNNDRLWCDAIVAKKLARENYRSSLKSKGYTILEINTICFELDKELGDCDSTDSVILDMTDM